MLYSSVNALVGRDGVYRGQWEYNNYTGLPVDSAPEKHNYIFWITRHTTLNNQNQYNYYIIHLYYLHWPLYDRRYTGETTEKILDLSLKYIRHHISPEYISKDIVRKCAQLRFCQCGTKSYTSVWSSNFRERHRVYVRDETPQVSGSHRRTPDRCFDPAGIWGRRQVVL